jgi:hypothetical protein
MPLPEPLRPLVELWLAAVRTPRRRATAGALVLLFVLAMFVARVGTVRARVGAGAGLAAVVIGLVVWSRRERRAFERADTAIERLVGRVDPERAQSALRALSLLAPDANDGTSPALAQLHVARTLAALPRDRIARGATRSATAWGVAALVLAVGALGACATNPFGVVEGADVLVALQGVAPIGLSYVGEQELRARPPDYLHMDEKRHPLSEPLALPRGTLVTVRGLPLHSGRRLALSDGSSEVPFVDDGSGRVVARWPLAGSVTLRILARFGDVVIEETQRTEITSVEDAAPIVKLEGAPRTIELATAHDAGEIPIRYEATDDHGLREVHLVLRSGAREERRVLARLDGETRFDRGGHVLRHTDPFVKKSHAPVEVRVEAKDNDPITGPKWGASPSITIVPPDVGQAEAIRLDALRKLRDAFVDELAWRLAHDVPADATERKSFVSHELKAAGDHAELLEATLTGTYAGLRVSPRLQAMLRGQMRKVQGAVFAESRAPTSASHAAVVKATERITLVTDAIIQGLALRDAKSSAKQLADSADDLALGLSQMQRPADKDRGAARADAAVGVLRGGERSLKQLGALGRDLGEIVETDLLRVARARKDGDFFHAELAARDLAARLRQPDPSFGSRGSSGRAGGESGGERGTPGEAGEAPDEVDRAFNEAAQELEKLAMDHASGMGKVEQTLSGGGSDEDLKAFRDEAKKHADAVRDAVKDLPSIGGGSDSWTSKGAASREHGEQMARSLEQGNPADAVTSGKSALQALDDAKRAAAREAWMGYGHADGAGERLDQAKKKLEPEVRWAEKQLEALRRRAAERAAGQLQQHGDEEEKMADRARQLADKGRDQEALPAPALDALSGAEKSARDAARSLKRGDVDKGLEQQRDAQRQLEAAREALGTAEKDEPHGTSDGDREPPSSGHADIPKADAHKGPEEFRKRVIRGLGQPSGRHKDAVRRYAEGLLR